MDIYLVLDSHKYVPFLILISHASTSLPHISFLTGKYILSARINCDTAVSRQESMFHLESRRRCEETSRTTRVSRVE